MRDETLMKFVSCRVSRRDKEGHGSPAEGDLLFQPPRHTPEQGERKKTVHEKVRDIVRRQIRSWRITGTGHEKNEEGYKNGRHPVLHIHITME